MASGSSSLRSWAGMTELDVTVPPGPWKLKNPREPKVQVGVGIMKTTVNTEPTPEELIKVRWISAAHETRRNRQEGMWGVMVWMARGIMRDNEML